MAATARGSPSTETAPTMAVSSSPERRARTPASSARRPEVSSLEMVKLGPPTWNSRAMRLATMPPSAPMVRLAERAGPALSRRPAKNSFSSFSERFQPCCRACSRAVWSSDQRKWKLAVPASRPRPMKTPAFSSPFSPGP